MHPAYFYYLNSRVSPSQIANQIYDSHYARVTADGGVIESEARTKSYLTSMIDSFNLASQSGFKTSFPVSLDPYVFGYKLGAGSGQTLGIGVEKLYSINENYDVIQATAGDQPVLLSHTGDNYVWFPRVSGNTVTSGSSPISFTQATDTAQITVKIFTNTNYVISSETIAQFGSVANFRLNIASGGIFSLNFRSSANAAASSTYTPSTSQPHWVRLVLTPTNATYYWSADGATFNDLGTVALPTMNTTVSSLILGTGTSATNSYKVYSATFENTTTATTITCNPSQYDRTASETTWTGGGTSWTINTDALVTGFKTVMVDRTIVVGNGVNSKLANASVSINQAYTAYALFKRLGTGVTYGLGASSQLSNDGTNVTVNNGAALSTGNSGEFRELISAVCNGATSSLQINNGVRIDGDAGANNTSYIELFANGATYGTYILETFIISSTANTEAQRTDIFDLFYWNISDAEYDDSYYDGEENLTQWNAFKAAPAEQFDVVFIGDSWIEEPVRFADPIIDWMRGLYGNAGGGFICVGDSDAYDGSTVYSAGWTLSYEKETGIGLNKKHLQSSTINDTITITPTVTTTEYTLIYIREVGAGTFAYKVGSGSETIVDANNASTAIGTVVITGSATDALTIRVDTVSTTGVKIIGAILKNTTNGIRAHKMGMSGINATQVPQWNLTYFTDQFSLLNAKLVFILLGSNDMNANVTPVSFEDGLVDIIVDRIRAVTPACDIVICPSGSNGLLDKTYTIDHYQRRGYDAANDNTCVFVNLAKVIGNYTDANADGNYEDDLHVNAAGGTVLGNAVIEILD